MRRWAKVGGLTLLSVFASILALYLFLMTMQAYSARQASRVLSRLEALRIGDPAADFSRAVEGCDFQDGIYILVAGPYRFELPARLLQRLPGNWSDRAYLFANRLGLRDWQLRTSSAVQEGKIAGVSTLFIVFGRYEMLGSGWKLGSSIPPGYERYLTNDDERRTHVHWFHISSLPTVGEGIEILTTTRSTPKELQARSVNRKCMLTSVGCDGLCELLPDAVEVLKERNRSWGDYASVPAPSCAGN